MTTKHTPGPWKAVEAAYNPPGWLWVQNGPGALLADVHQNKNIALDARNANARLMAAAPELLEACRYAERFLRATGTHIKNGVMACRYCGAELVDGNTHTPECNVAKLRSAIRRATGEEG